MRKRETYGGRDIKGSPKPLEWQIEPENTTLTDKGDEQNDS